MMLKELCIKNLYNFKNEVHIDFTVSENESLNHKYIKESVSNFVLIYGKNNVGKSNLFKIVKEVSDLVLKNEYKLDYYRPNGEDITSLFEVVLEDDSGEYIYGLKLDVLNKNIEEEYLIFNNQDIFKSENKKQVELKNYEEGKVIIDFFTNITYIRSESSEELICKNINNLNDKKFDILNTLLKVSDLDIKKIVRIDNNIKFLKDETTSFLYKEISSGTKRVLSIGSSVLNSIEKKSLFLIDELDSGLHLELISVLVNFLRYAISYNNDLQIVTIIHREDLLDYYFISDESKIFLSLEADDSIEVSYLSQYILSEGHIASNRYKLDAFQVNPNTTGEYELLIKVADLGNKDE